MPVVVAVGAVVAEVAADVAVATAAVSGVVGSVIGAGVVADTIAAGVVGATIGAGLGAGEAAITGGDPGAGALGGAITGGFTGGAGSAFGVTGDIAAMGAIGAGGGALSAGVTGGNPLLGAATGAVSGAASAALSGSGGTPTPEAGGGTPVAGPEATITPAGGGGTITPSATEALGTQAIGDVGGGSAAVPGQTQLGSVAASPIAPPGPSAAAIDALNAPGGGDLLAPVAPGPTTEPVNPQGPGFFQPASPGPTTEPVTPPSLGPGGVGPTTNLPAGVDAALGPAASPAPSLSFGDRALNSLADFNPFSSAAAPPISPEADLQAQLAAEGSNPAATDTMNSAVTSALGNPASDPASGGFGQGLKDVLGNPATKLGLAALPAAFTLLNGQPAVPQDIQPLSAGGAVTAPLIATETANLNAFNTGTLSPGDAAQVANYRQQAQTALFQQLANQGVTNPTQDSRYIAGMQQIEQNAKIVTQQFLNASLTAGLQAAGSASTALIAAANAQVQQDTNFQNALDAAMQSFGLIVGSGAFKQAA